MALPPQYARLDRLVAIIIDAVICEIEAAASSDQVVCSTVGVSRPTEPVTPSSTNCAPEHVMQDSAVARCV
jgi:hypothetical protein